MGGWGSGAWGSGAWGSGAGTGSNLGFEIPGASQGVPDDWTLNNPLTAFMSAGFEATSLAFDSFETWVLGGFISDNSGLISPADFGGEEGAEEFDWFGPVLEVATLIAASWNVSNPDGPKNVEEFETYWDGNQDWKTDFVGVGTDLVAASFSGDPAEDFEENWSGNQDWKLDFVGFGTDIVAGVFGRPPLTNTGYEDFEGVFTDLEFFGFPGADELETVSNHTRAIGNRIYFRNESGSIPSPLQENVRYYVFSVPSAIRVQVATQAASLSPVNIQDFGTGTSFLQADPVYYWQVAP